MGLGGNMFSGSFQEARVLSGSLETKGGLLGAVAEGRCKSKPPGPCDSCHAALPVFTTHRFARDCSSATLWSGLRPVLGWGWYRPGQSPGKEKVLLHAPCSQGKVLLSPKGLDRSWYVPGVPRCHPAPLLSIMFLPPVPWCQWHRVSFGRGPGPGPLKGVSPAWVKSTAWSSHVQWSVRLGAAPTSAWFLSCSALGREPRPSSRVQGGSKVGGDMALLLPTLLSGASHPPASCSCSCSASSKKGCLSLLEVF